MNTSLFEPFYNSSGICTDSREIQANSLFICIKGDNFDGNQFAEQALHKGAIHVIVDNPDSFIDNGKMTLVKDSVIYLQKLANYHRRKFDIPVIGITGSNGKTTTKEILNIVLSKKYNVLATRGNLNNHLGVPFTLLRITEQHEIAIIEMGANKFKDIEELCAIAEPNYGIITNIGKAHLEGFKDFNGVLKTKKELYDFVSQNNGTLIVNSDDKILMDILPPSTRHITYGLNSEEIRGELVNLSPFVEMIWSHGDYTSSLLKTKMIGKYNFYNYLAACTFGTIFNIDKELISQAIQEYNPTNNRSQVKKTDQNTLILDCYNANPTSVHSALESFSMNLHPNKVVILGDMKELGKESRLEHIKVINQLENLGISGYTVGIEFTHLQSDAILKSFLNSSEMIEHLKSKPISGQLILLKGSRSIGLEVLENYL